MHQCGAIIIVVHVFKKGKLQRHRNKSSSVALKKKVTLAASSVMKAKKINFVRAHLGMLSVGKDF